MFRIYWVKRLFVRLFNLLSRDRFCIEIFYVARILLRKEVKRKRRLCVLCLWINLNKFSKKKKNSSMNYILAGSWRRLAKILQLSLSTSWLQPKSSRHEGKHSSGFFSHCFVIQMVILILLMLTILKGEFKFWDDISHTCMLPWPTALVDV